MGRPFPSAYHLLGWPSVILHGLTPLDIKNLKNPEYSYPYDTRGNRGQRAHMACPTSHCYILYCLGAAAGGDVQCYGRSPELTPHPRAPSGAQGDGGNHFLWAAA